MNSKGVTLIELIVVVAIIGILAMIAIPSYLGQQKSAARTEAYSNLENLRLLEEQFFAENGCYYKSSGSCANVSITGTDNVKSALPGFKPGDAASLSFDYNLSAYTVSGATAGGFTATAKGRSARVKNDTFTIDNNNSRNF
jgi:prepilin-type N-terminal cleavage/methylation domain-containing protein